MTLARMRGRGARTPRRNGLCRPHAKIALDYDLVLFYSRAEVLNWGLAGRCRWCRARRCLNGLSRVLAELTPWSARGGAPALSGGCAGSPGIPHEWRRLLAQGGRPRGRLAGPASAAKNPAEVDICGQKWTKADVPGRGRAASHGGGVGVLERMRPDEVTARCDEVARRSAVEPRGGQRQARVTLRKRQGKPTKPRFAEAKRRAGTSRGRMRRKPTKADR
jgi:hypothetical protein